MTYWKFLRTGAVSPFTGYVWPRPGEWVEASGPDPCRTGLHACRAGDLPYWLVDELWQVELSGPVVAGRHKVVAPRARLIARVSAWTGDRARDLSAACLRRTAAHAAAELRAAGLDDVAARLTESCRVPGDAAARAAAEAERQAKDRRARRAARLCGYVSDAAAGFETYPPASLAYIAARAASMRGAPETDDPYAAERAWQARWLADRLNLHSLERLEGTP